MAQQNVHDVRWSPNPVELWEEWMMDRNLVCRRSGGTEPEEGGQALEKMEWMEEVKDALVVELQPPEVVWRLDEWVAGDGCGGCDERSWCCRSRSSRRAASRSCCSRKSRTEDSRVSLSSAPIFFRSSFVGGEEVSLDPDG